MIAQIHLIYPARVHSIFKNDANIFAYLSLTCQPLMQASRRHLGMNLGWKLEILFKLGSPQHFNE